MTAAQQGRARDPRIDDSVLEVATRHLSTHGYEAMSVSAVAAEAGTTRQALYRRWPNKAELARAAMRKVTDARPEDGASGRSAEAEDAFTALVDELDDFRRGVSRPGRLSLVGTMLQACTDSDAQRRYRQRVVAPRRKRLRAILDRGVTDGSIDADADLDVAVTMLTGSWYAIALAGNRPPPDWPLRTATLVWRALGGDSDHRNWRR